MIITAAEGLVSNVLNASPRPESGKACYSVVHGVANECPVPAAG
jgi:hypothetical protein